MEKIKPLDIEIYKQGTCFICNLPCDTKGYAHFSCCIAYSDHKSKLLNDLNKEKESKQDKRFERIIKP